MPPSVLTVIACTPILAGWIAVSVVEYRSGHRRRRQAAEWSRFTAGQSELDAELDRAWAAEAERIRRYP